jgi:protocatechuate 3,4-dioxygenase beta subunit
MHERTTSIFMSLLIAASIATATGAPLRGRVLNAGGKPAADVLVYVVSARQVLLLSSDGTPVIDQDPPVKTDVDGRFTSNAKSATFLIVAVSPDGIAEINETDFAREPSLRLAPWASIDGKAMIGSAPAAHVRVDVSSAGTSPRNGPDFPPNVVQEMQSVTDADGDFHFPKVMPGQGAISRMILIPESDGQLTQSSAFSLRIKLEPRADEKLTLGGVGRPVVGKVVIPPEVAARKDWYDRAWVRHTQTPQSSALRDYAFALGPDGSFRVDDIESGDYQVTVLMMPNKPGAFLAEAHSAFTMPPVDGGRSDVPLQIADIAAQPGKGINIPEAPSPQKPVGSRTVVGRLILPPDAGDVKRMHIRIALRPEIASLVTDSDGLFRIEGVTPGEYSMQAYATVSAPDDYFAFASFVVAAAGKDDQPVRLGDISLREQPGIFEPRRSTGGVNAPGIDRSDAGLPAKPLQGRVIDAAGAPLAGTKIRMELHRGFPFVVVTTAVANADGSFQVPGATLMGTILKISKDGYFATEVEIRPGDTEKSITLHLIPRFQGNVTDSVTNKPIDSFQLYAEPQIPGWRRRGFVNPQTFSAGSYDLSPSDEFGLANGWILRVEAPGHLPAVTPVLQNSAKHDLQLQPAPDLQGRVVDADGKPVAGAQIAAAPTWAHVYWRDGTLTTYRAGFDALSQADGSFHLPPAIDPLRFYVVSENGFAKFDWNPGQPLGDIKLSAGGRIEGRVMHGTEPVIGQKVQIRYVTGQPPATNPSDLYLVSLDPITQDAQSGPDGRFSIDRVFPGEYEASRMEQAPPMGSVATSPIPMQTTNVTISSGETAAVQIGGKGRTVHAKIILPASFPAMPNDYIIVKLADKGKPIRRFPAMVDSDGVLVADDLVAGDYTVTLWAESRVAQLYARGMADFTVPTMNADRSNLPLDIPDMVLTAYDPRSE